MPTRREYLGRVYRFLFTIVFLFALFPDPFMWMIDEIVAWSLLVIVIGYVIYKKYIKNIDSYEYLYDK